MHTPHHHNTKKKKTILSIELACLLSVISYSLWKCSLVFSLVKLRVKPNWAKRILWKIESIYATVNLFDCRLYQISRITDFSLGKIQWFIAYERKIGNCLQYMCCVYCVVALAYCDSRRQWMGFAYKWLNFNSKLYVVKRSVSFTPS